LSWGGSRARSGRKNVTASYALLDDTAVIEAGRRRAGWPLLPPGGARAADRDQPRGWAS